MNIFKPLIITIILGLTTSVYAATDRLVIGTQYIAMPPYINIDEATGDVSGLIIDVLSELEKELEVEVSVVTLPHARAIRDLKSGTIDGFIAWSWKDERSDFVSYPMKDGQPDPSRSVFTESYVLYTLKSSGISWDGEKFNKNDVTVGVNELYSIYGDLKEKGLRLDGAKYDTRTNLERLLMGRISAAITLESIGDNAIQSNDKFKENIIKLSPVVITKAYYLVLSRPFAEKNPEVAENIWNTIKQIRSD